MNHKPNRHSAIQSAALGFGCSSAAIALTFPVESLARQFHVTSSSQANTASLIRGMMSRGRMGFYKGLTPALVCQPLFWAVYMPTHRALKDIVGGNPGVYTNMALGWTAGAIGAVATNPVWVVRQRMQTEIVREQRNNSYPKLIRSMWKEDGLRTFMRGTGVTTLKNIQMAFLLPLFDTFQDSAKQGTGLFGPVQERLGTGLTVAVAAASAKILASTPVYPLDIIRTNIRFMEGEHIRFVDAARDVLGRPGGARNLFRGIGWYWTHSAATFAVMMSLMHYATAD